MVARFEDKAGIPLPEPVRKLLTEVVNGGHIRKEIDIPVSRDGSETLIMFDALFGLAHPRHYCDLLAEDLKKWINDEGAIPIGYDVGGGITSYMLGGERAGQIWHCLYDTIGPPECYFVAKDMDEFIAILRREMSGDS